MKNLKNLVLTTTVFVIVSAILFIISEGVIPSIISIPLVLLAYLPLFLIAYISGYFIVSLLFLFMLAPVFYFIGLSLTIIFILAYLPIIVVSIITQNQKLLYHENYYPIKVSLCYIYGAIISLTINVIAYKVFSINLYQQVFEFIKMTLLSINSTDSTILASISNLDFVISIFSMVLPGLLSALISLIMIENLDLTRKIIYYNQNSLYFHPSKKNIELPYYYSIVFLLIIIVSILFNKYIENHNYLLYTSYSILFVLWIGYGHTGLLWAYSYISKQNIFVILISIVIFILFFVEILIFVPIIGLIISLNHKAKNGIN